jgi:hypothetical protein
MTFLIKMALQKSDFVEITIKLTKTCNFRTLHDPAK